MILACAVVPSLGVCQFEYFANLGLGVSQGQGDRQDLQANFHEIGSVSELGRLCKGRLKSSAGAWLSVAGLARDWRARDWGAGAVSS